LKKVLIISYYWPPGSGAGVQRWVKLSKYLSDAGVETHVLTVNPEQASYPVRDESLLLEVGSRVILHHCDTREWFKAYAKISGNEKIPFAGFAGEKKPGLFQYISRFIRGNFFIPDPRRGWNQFALAKAIEIIEKFNIKTIVTTSPPHSTQLVGLKLKEKPGIEWIADLRDPWTDIYYYKKFYHLAYARNLDRYYERKVLETADRVLVVSKDIKRLFSGKSAKIDASKINVLPNGYDEADFQFQKKEKRSLSFSVAYIGTCTAEYPLDSFLPVVSEFSKLQAMNLSFTGSVSHPVLEKFSQIPGVNLQLNGYVNHASAIAAMTEGSVLLLLIPETADNRGILTGKLFEYLRSGSPVLGIGPVDGDASAILIETGAGRMFAPKDTAGMIDFLSQVLQGKKQERNLAAIKNYSRETQARLIEKWIV